VIPPAGHGFRPKAKDEALKALRDVIQYGRMECEARANHASVFRGG
jgi:hypothetical protein